VLGWSFCRPFSWWFRPFSWSTFLLGCGITWKVTKFVGHPIVVSLVPVVLTSPSSACQVIDAEENVSTIGAALTSQPDDLRVHSREMRTVGRKFSLPQKSADSSLAAAINPSNLENHQRIKNKTIFGKIFCERSHPMKKMKTIIFLLSIILDFHLRRFIQIIIKCNNLDWFIENCLILLFKKV
jgi:hypothetical protein